MLFLLLVHALVCSARMAATQLWTLCLWRLPWTGDLVRASHTVFLHSSRAWFGGVWEQLWPWVDTTGCTLLSMNIFAKIPEGCVETFKGLNYLKSLESLSFWNRKRSYFQGCINWFLTSHFTLHCLSVCRNLEKLFAFFQRCWWESKYSAIVWQQESPGSFLQACRVI